MIVSADQLASAYLFICLVGEANLPTGSGSGFEYRSRCIWNVNVIQLSGTQEEVLFPPRQMHLAKCQHAQYHLL